MNYLHNKSRKREELADSNPLTGVANLFDLGLVFMVGLLLALLGAYRLEDLLLRDSKLTITKQSADGRMEIIVKKGTQVDAMTVTEDQAEGKGQRLGIAYKLADGSFIYVPDQEQVPANQ